MLLVFVTSSAHEQAQITLSNFVSVNKILVYFLLCSLIFKVDFAQEFQNVVPHEFLYLKIYCLIFETKETHETNYDSSGYAIYISVLSLLFSLAPLSNMSCGLHCKRVLSCAVGFLEERMKSS